MGFVSDASMLDDKAVLQLIEHGNTYGSIKDKRGNEKLFLARSQITADSSPQDLAHAFFHIWKSWIHYVRDDPHKPNPEQEEAIDEQQRLIHLQGMIASIVPMIEAAKLLQVYDSSEYGHSFVLRKLFDAEKACNGRLFDEDFYGVFNKKLLPRATDLYLLIIDGHLPEVMKDHLEWAKDKLHIATTPIFVMQTLKSSLPVNTPLFPRKERTSKENMERHPYRPGGLPTTQSTSDQTLEC